MTSKTSPTASDFSRIVTKGEGHFLSHLSVTRPQMVETFGEPDARGEWSFLGKDGFHYTVYAQDGAFRVAGLGFDASDFLAWLTYRLNRQMKLAF